MQAINLRQHLPEESRPVQQFERPAGPPLRKHPRHLIPDPLPADHPDPRGRPPDRCLSSRFDLKIKAGRKPHRSQHAQLIFLKALLSIADRPHQPRAEISAPANVVEYRRIHISRLPQDLRIEQHPIEGEVASLHIFFGAIGEPHRFRPSPICI